MTSSGTHIRNGMYILDLLNAIQLPSELAVVKCAAHKSGTDPITAGNQYADEVARYYAHQTCTLDQERYEKMYYDLAAQNLISVADTWDEI